MLERVEHLTSQLGLMQSCKCGHLPIKTVSFRNPRDSSFWLTSSSTSTEMIKKEVLKAVNGERATTIRPSVFR
jgi:hypothetical protein